MTIKEIKNPQIIESSRKKYNGLLADLTAGNSVCVTSSDMDLRTLQQRCLGVGIRRNWKLSTKTVELASGETAIKVTRHE
jgi:hypothetical protein